MNHLPPDYQISDEYPVLISSFLSLVSNHKAIEDFLKSKDAELQLKGQELEAKEDRIKEIEQDAMAHQQALKDVLKSKDAELQLKGQELEAKEDRIKKIEQDALVQQQAMEDVLKSKDAELQLKCQDLEAKEDRIKEIEQDALVQQQAMEDILKSKNAELQLKCQELKAKEDRIKEIGQDAMAHQQALKDVLKSKDAELQLKGQELEAKEDRIKKIEQDALVQQQAMEDVLKSKDAELQIKCQELTAKEDRIKEIEQDAMVPQQTMDGVLGSKDADLQLKCQELAAKEDRIKELEQETMVHRRAIAFKNQDERKNVIELECLRDSFKALSEKTKHLQKQLEGKHDLEAENTAIKHLNAAISEDNARMKKDVIRLKKMYGCAEARADENEHILLKATSRAPPFINPLDGPLPNQSMFNRQPSAFSTPKPRSGAASPARIIRSSPTFAKRQPYISSKASNFPAFSNQTPPVPRKRGIMLDLTEPVNRERLDFKVHALSDKNKRRVEHLTSHYDPSLGTYDESFGESPTKAAVISKATPKKDGFFQSILRKKNSL